MLESRDPFLPPSTHGDLRALPTELAVFADGVAEQYVVERLLGRGGMATVLLARDRKHGRHVALKVVHPDLGAALGRERFLAEIRTTASLQHPHILPLLGSGEAAELLYYVMPHVEGETLRERLTRERQLPLEDALRLAIEIGDALGYAHEHGIIHRDIKPENVLLQGGHALVTDFGIALAVQQAGGERMTQTGLSLGTPQYMSPEQAMGERTIDGRSDIYALGAVLYEMLAGEPPFTGASVQAIVAKVLTERPVAPSVVRDSVPRNVDHAILKALAKTPADRWSSTQRFAEALRQPEGPPPVSPEIDRAPSDPSQRSSVRRWTRPTAIAVALVAIAAAWWLGRRSAPHESPWSSFTQLTDASGVETGPSLSPDGESFAYAGNARGTWDIYVQRIGGQKPLLVAGDSTADETWPAYSPDGKQIAYEKRGLGIFVMGATGESPRRLTTFGANPAWSPDGRQVVFGSENITSPYTVNGTGALWVVPSTGGNAERLEAEGSGDSYQPAWSPSGKRIAFWLQRGGQRDLATIPAGGGARVLVTNDAAVDWAPAWSPDGRSLYFASDRGGTMGLWRIRIDEGSGHARGAPEPVAAGVDAAMDLPQVGRDGATLVFRSFLLSVNPAAVAFDAANARIGATSLLQHRTGVLLPADVSPDGEWLALSNVTERQEDIFVMRRDGSALARLMSDLARDRGPRFRPDGKGMTFYSNQSATYQVWQIELDGGGRTRLTDVPSTTYTMFAPDGKRLLLSDISGRGPVAIATAPWPAKEKSLTPLGRLTVNDGVLIPNYWTRGGHWLSGPILSSRTHTWRGHGVYDLTTKSVTQLNDDSDGLELAWLPDERHVLYLTSRGTLVMQDVVTLARRTVKGTLPYPVHPQLSSIVASPDGRTLYYAASAMEGNIWMVRRAAATRSEQ